MDSCWRFFSKNIRGFLLTLLSQDTWVLVDATFPRIYMDSCWRLMSKNIDGFLLAHLFQEYTWVPVDVSFPRIYMVFCWRFFSKNMHGFLIICFFSKNIHGFLLTLIFKEYTWILVDAYRPRIYMDSFDASFQLCQREINTPKLRSEEEECVSGGEVSSQPLWTQNTLFGEFKLWYK